MPKKPRLVGLAVGGRFDAEKMNADAVGLGYLHTNANILVARQQDGVRDGVIPREFDEVGYDQ